MFKKSILLLNIFISITVDAAISQVSSGQAILSEKINEIISQSNTNEVKINKIGSRVKATMSTSQSIPNLLLTNLIFNNEVWDKYSEYDSTSGIFSPIESGIYEVCASVAPMTGGYVSPSIAEVFLYKNSVEESILAKVGHNFVSNIGVILYGCDEIYLNSGDEAVLKFIHNFGTFQSINIQNNRTRINIKKVGDL